MAAGFKKPTRKVRRVLAAMLFVSGMLVAVSAASPQHALADSCTVQAYGTLLIDGQYVTQVVASSPSNVTCYNKTIAHDCINMGGNGGVSAIECADIDMTWSSSAVEAWGLGTYYCQGTGALPQCAAMSVDQVFYWDANTSSQGSYGHPGGNYTCTGASCPNGGKAMVDTYHHLGSQSAASGHCTVPIITKDEASNSITMPDGDKITNPKPPSTPLISVCFFFS